MKLTYLLTISILSIFPVFAQNKLCKDIDFDEVIDTVFIDKEKSTIVCQLSSENFKRLESKPIEILKLQNAITDAKDGFYFTIDWMRSGFSNQFRYDKKTKKIRLIGMSSYQFGNAVNDGSGESSVNLLTGDYIGNWSYYDYQKDTLIKIPTIRTKMYFNKIYLEDFSDETYFDYAERCSKLYYKYRDELINIHE